jgi:hypothetical protein
LEAPKAATAADALVGMQSVAQSASIPSPVEAQTLIEMQEA